MHIFSEIIFNSLIATAAFSSIAAIVHLKTAKDIWLQRARSALTLHLFSASLAMALLLFFLLAANFSFVYVAEHVNRQLPFFYRVTSLWAGQAGSQLLWNFLLILFAYVGVRHIRRVQSPLEPYMIAILMIVSLGFASIGAFSQSSDPFRVFTEGESIFAHADGRGLNPLLQHWAMIIHPPILYLGYVSFAIPYAIAMSALMYGNPDLQWTKIVRRWTLFSWFFLGAGILLGGKWAYEELGWGGYWAWDPVENASLMPWLTATAFLHSIIVQERRGMLKVWNMVLVSLSFVMTIVGTALTRSGVVQSVHAFAQSNLGSFFLVFILLIALFSFIVILRRLPQLKPDAILQSLLSREVGFLFNNVLLVASLFIIFFGTLYPTLSEGISGQRESVTAEWFNKFMAPMGILILLLTGLGPLLAWRITKLSTLWKNSRLPLMGGLITFAVSFALTHSAFGKFKLSHYYAITTFALSVFIVIGVTEEYIRALIARKHAHRESWMRALIQTLFQNKRRFLGYQVHIALAILFSGFAGQAYGTEGRLLLSAGEATELYGYTFHLESMREKAMPENEPVPLYGTRMAQMAIYRNNLLIGRDTTEIRTYPMFSLADQAYSDTQNTSEPAIISGFTKDIYLQLGGEEKGKYILQYWINPLVKWVWGGFAFFVIMGLLLLLPVGERRKEQ